MTFSPEKIATTPELFAKFRLFRSVGVGPSTFRKLISKHGSASRLIDGIEQKNHHQPLVKELAAKADGMRELEHASSIQAKYLFLGEPGYPQLLAELSDAPPIICIKGRTELLTAPAIAVVGARNCSAGGAKLTRNICSALAASGYTVVSGLARGIDTAAHEASVNKGTIACLAGGLDVIYPKENSALYQRITEEGAIVSEMPLGTQPQARHFPRRNRIISGLSKGLLVIEAARKSGTLITASYAAEQNRDVFVVPGSPLDPRAQGGNQLIRDGAILVQTAAEIIHEYESMPLLRSIDVPIKKPLILQKPTLQQEKTGNNHTNKLPSDALTGSRQIMDFLTPEPIHIDEIVRLSGLTVETLLTGFTELELMGHIVRHSNGMYSRVSAKIE